MYILLYIHIYVCIWWFASALPPELTEFKPCATLCAARPGTRLAHPCACTVSWHLVRTLCVPCACLCVTLCATLPATQGVPTLCATQLPAQAMPPFVRNPAAGTRSGTRRTKKQTAI